MSVPDHVAPAGLAPAADDRLGLSSYICLGLPSVGSYPPTGMLNGLGLGGSPGPGVGTTWPGDGAPPAAAALRPGGKANMGPRPPVPCPRALKIGASFSMFVKPLGCVGLATCMNPGVDSAPCNLRCAAAASPGAPSEPIMPASPAALIPPPVSLVPPPNCGSPRPYNEEPTPPPKNDGATPPPTYDGATPPCKNWETEMLPPGTAPGIPPNIGV